ncbi:hypothetical protein [Bdellovibrio bacteriovorus]|uniref:Uncharacterized protein n=1 Tax=Bdellovibrio bacteriovorus str. Tiberius TaxID=1069642 RepID=K7ZF18_BDEBC|nr:hypothetical protein [Bdellovibrio bacteriovorus]AFY01052.1 hypothetical protein Bdt_1354 [Bdellovibrio bacteriovorus str. Tiberius]
MNTKPKKNRSICKKEGDEKTNGMTTSVTPVLTGSVAAVFK